MFSLFHRVLVQAIAALLIVAPAQADTDLPMPKGDVILTVSGAISKTNKADTAVFDIDTLRAFDETTFVTTTIWTEGEQTFTGVSLHDLLEVLGVEGGTLNASAINDYTVEIPVSDAVEGGPIIAYQRNGAEMSIRDKGPLWIVYPFDANPDYKSEQIYSRSIWQLDRIEIVN